MSMPGLVKVVISPRQSGYLDEGDIRKFLVNAFGNGIDFKIRVSGTLHLV